MCPECCIDAIKQLNVVLQVVGALLDAVAFIQIHPELHARLGLEKQLPITSPANFQPYFPQRQNPPVCQEMLEETGH